MKSSQLAAALATAIAMLALGCGDKSAQTANSSPRSSASPTTTQPANAQPATAQTTPVQSAPAPQPEPPPPPPPVVIPVGTVLSVHLQQAVGSKTSNDGDRVAATLAQPLVVGTQVVVPKGANAYGTVTEAHAAGKFKGAATLRLSLTRLEISGTPVEIKTVGYAQTSTGKGKRTAGMIGGGAAGGALIGGLAGGGKGAGIGALVGAGAGTAGAAYTGNRDISLPAETTVNFKLTEPITIQQ